MITQGVKAIAITPTSPNVQAALDKAVEAGIKVVLIDNDIPGWTGKSSVVATDNLAGGKLAGDWLAKKLPAGAKLGVLQGRLGNPSLDDRVKGMLERSASRRRSSPKPADRLRPDQGAQRRPGHPDRAPGRRRRSTAPAARPIIGALAGHQGRRQEPGEIIVVGFDASPDELAAIKAGDEAASVAQFPAKMGSLGIETAYKAAKGETVEPNVDTGTEMVTKDNAADFK